MTLILVVEQKEVHICNQRGKIYKILWKNIVKWFYFRFWPHWPLTSPWPQYLTLWQKSYIFVLREVRAIYSNDNFEIISKFLFFDLSYRYRRPFCRKTGSRRKKMLGVKNVRLSSGNRPVFVSSLYLQNWPSYGRKCEKHVFLWRAFRELNWFWFRFVSFVELAATNILVFVWSLYDKN